MKVSIKGKGDITLNNNQFLSQGGEGKIFVKDNIAFKIYLDPNKMIPVGKINELSVLTDPNIIKPQDVLIDANNKPIGYTMRFIKGNYSLCQAFTRAFRDRNNLTNDIIIKLVQKFRNQVNHIHNHKILIVDCNEMNFLLDSNFDNILHIDVDSYKTPSYPATAIMESVRDRHSKSFNELTDFFSFGILTFQMLIGIHPYRGKHPDYKTLDERMIKNISVFNKNVSIPKVCYSFDNIPQAWRDWYKAIFEDGKRLPPPLGLQPVALISKPITTTVVGNNIFDIKEIFEYNNDIISYFSMYGVDAVITTHNVYLGSRIAKQIIDSRHTNIALTPKMNNVVLVEKDLFKLKLTNLTKGEPIISNIISDDFMTYNGRVYTQNGQSLYEVEFLELPKATQATIKQVANTLESGTKFFDGVVIQNLLGAYYVSIFPESGTHYQIHIKELDSYRIVDAKYDNNILMIIGEKGGKYDRFVFKLAKDFISYSTEVKYDIIHTGLNFVVLDNGICVFINEDEKLEIFSNNNIGKKTIEDATITGEMKLFKNGSQVLFSKDNKIYSLTMRKS